MQKRKIYFSDPPGKKLKMNSQEQIVNVRVYSRLRPIEEEEGTIRISGSTLVINQGEKLSFDYIFGPEASSRELFYALCAPVLDEFVRNGGNGGVFAYGASGSGKSHTILGIQSQKGLIPLSLSYLLSQKVVLTIQFYEVFSDSLYDLLGERNRTWTKIRGENSLSGLTQRQVSSYTEAIGVLNKGVNNRKPGLKQSHQPHLVFSLGLRGAKFVFIDVSAPVGRKMVPEHSKGIRNLLRCIENKGFHGPEVLYGETGFTSLFADLFIDPASSVSLIININPVNRCLPATKNILSTLYRLLTPEEPRTHSNTISRLLAKQRETMETNRNLLIEAYERVLQEEPLRQDSSTSPRKPFFTVTTSSFSLLSEDSNNT